MKKLPLSLIALTLLTAPPVFADSHEFVLPEELKAGQKGYGLTVFQGTEPEKFEVVFVSVSPFPFYPKEKAILVRLGKPLQNTNIISGMSGSPIYFKHKGKWKLAGALSFGWNQSQNGEPLAGVTPISLMINQQKVLGLKEIPQSADRPALEKDSDKLKPGESIAMVFSDGDHKSYNFGTVT